MFYHFAEISHQHLNPQFYLDYFSCMMRYVIWNGIVHLVEYLMPEILGCLSLAYYHADLSS